LKRRGQVIAPAFDQEEVEAGEIPEEKVHRLEVHRRVFPIAVWGQPPVSTPTTRAAGRAPRRMRKLGVLLRVDVVGDQRPCRTVAQSEAQRLRQRGLARADGAADSDLQRAREA